MTYFYALKLTWRQINFHFKSSFAFDFADFGLEKSSPQY